MAMEMFETEYTFPEYTDNSVTFNSIYCHTVAGHLRRLEPKFKKVKALNFRYGTRRSTISQNRRAGRYATTDKLYFEAQKI